MEIQFSSFDYLKELKAQRVLFEECFPETSGTPTLTEEHYQWKFHSKPGGKSAEFKACMDNEMLGYYAAIPYQYRCCDTNLRAAMVCDVMTGVKARGKGIFTKLGMYSTDELEKLGFDFTTGYPIRKEVIPGHLKAGWEIYFELPLYGKFIKFDSFLKKKRLSFVAPVVNGLFNLYSELVRRTFLQGASGLRVEVSTSEDHEKITKLSEFYRHWGKEIPISLVKDEEFLRWRLGAPEKKYYIFTLHDGNEIAGSLIAREVEREGIPCMGILDISLKRDYHQYACLLTGKLAKTAGKIGSELLLVMMQHNWYKKYKLRFDSFIKTPFRFFLILKQIKTTLADDFLKNPDNWHLMWIDSDDL